MNVWQISRQLKHLLSNAVWPGGLNRVFPAVIISPQVDDNLLSKFRLPLLAIRPMDAVSDPDKGEEPLLIQQKFAMRIFVANEHDGESENAIIGAHRVGISDGRGKGILEIEERLLEEIGRITGLNGMRIINTHRSAIAVEIETSKGSVVFRDYMFESLVGNSRFYHSPTRLTAVDAGGGTVDLEWKLPPDRFDFVKVELIRKSGSTPPTDTSDGTSVFESASATSYTDSPGSGTFSYGLFAWYDEDKIPPSDENIESEGDTISVTVA